MCRCGHYAISSLVLLAPVLASAQSDPIFYPNCPIPSETCVVYGVDFQNGGSYFQNTNSTAQFSFVQDFEGCDMDVAYNMLVDPLGDQTLCGNSNLTPSDLDMTSICPNYKNALFNGLWTIIVISNNGNCAPIAYQRDFILSVGNQATYTYTPTVTFTNVITPVSYMNNTSIFTVTSTAPALTTKVPATTRSHTRTITPPAVTATVTSASSTVPVTKWTWTVSPNIVTETASCIITPRATKPDPYLTIVPTLPAVMPLAQSILHDTAAPIVSATGGDVRRHERGGPAGHSRTQPGGWWGGWWGHQAGPPEWSWPGPWSVKERRAFLSAREARFAGRLQKRAPDSATVTVTQMNPALFVTISTAVTVSAMSMTTEVDITTTQTITPAPITVVTGVSVYRTRTTAVPVTITTTRYVPATINWTWATTTIRPMIQTWTTPTALASQCRARGGNLRSPRDARRGTFR